MTLTREEILAMEPGQELDELICNHIFDLEMVAHVHYSSDISAAWEVVTHLMNDHKDVLVQGVSFEKNRLFDCAIYEHEDELAVTSMQSSAPEAICKAALLAVLNL
ncbi:hypothetical protein MKX41_30770 [Paenibacillus sp. FSL R5-0475]|uniref:BC1872 family protein n=1 Tax=Paenibacillus sp. FSL R5-0475 TaxID=2921643 RepID=UPI0030F637E6